MLREIGTATALTQGFSTWPYKEDVSMSCGWFTNRRMFIAGMLNNLCEV